MTISDIIPDMKRDIREMQKEHSEVKFYDRLLDEHINKLSDLIGRKITKKEARKVFEIVERYSPKWQDGNIIDYFPFDLAWTLYKILKKNNFDTIVVAENGAEAVEQVKKQKFDLILMDMQMPIMNGFEATERIRLMPEYKDTPIIALTAFAMKGDREKCLEAGATDYIPKPIDSQEFIQKVKYYTDSKVGVS